MLSEQQGSRSGVESLKDALHNVHVNVKNMREWMDVDGFSLYNLYLFLYSNGEQIGTWAHSKLSVHLVPFILPRNSLKPRDWTRCIVDFSSNTDVSISPCHFSPAKGKWPKWALCVKAVLQSPLHSGPLTSPKILQKWQVMSDHVGSMASLKPFLWSSKDSAQKQLILQAT